MIRKGGRVLLVLTDGDEIEPPSADALLHDPSGRQWPARSVLVGPFSKGPRADEEEIPRAARDYLGRGYTIHEGSCSVEHLPRALSAWTREGDVEEIYYHRYGTKARGLFKHKFNKRFALAVLLLGRRNVTLYSRGQWLRLQLPRGAITDSRGFVFP